jgi:hypothetical protein
MINASGIGADAFGIDDAHQTEQQLISSAINELLTGPAHRSHIRRTTPHARACDGPVSLILHILERGFQIGHLLLGPFFSIVAHNSSTLRVIGRTVR